MTQFNKSIFANQKQYADALAMTQIPYSSYIFCPNCGVFDPLQRKKLVTAIGKVDKFRYPCYGIGRDPNYSVTNELRKM